MRAASWNCAPVADATKGTPHAVTSLGGCWWLKLQDAPPVVEVSPLPSSFSQQVTVLAVYFEVKEGNP
jgi:hypothetical protein